MKWTDAIAILLTPACWLQNYSFSAEWDAELTRLLNADEPLLIVDNCYARMGPYVIWIANHPYASFTTTQRRRAFRPSRSTILRAGALLRKHDVFEPVVSEQHR